MYAYFKNLVYFSTECIYSPNAYRGYARALLKDLEKIRPSVIVDILHSGNVPLLFIMLSFVFFQISICFFTGENISVKQNTRLPTRGKCQKCNFVSSQTICKACVLLAGLNKGLPKLGIGKSSKVKKIMDF